MRSVSSAGGDRAGERGLADAGLALEKQRPPQPERQEERNGQARSRRRSARPDGGRAESKWTLARSLLGYEHHFDERVAADRRKTDGGARGEILRKRRAINLVHAGELRHV